MTPILDGMCERLIFPDISKGRTEGCRKAPGQNLLCYGGSVEDPFTSNVMHVRKKCEYLPLG